MLKLVQSWVCPSDRQTRVEVLGESHQLVDLQRFRGDLGQGSEIQAGTVVKPTWLLQEILFHGAGFLRPALLLQPHRSLDDEPAQTQLDD
jgi:hypothetical protein